MKKLNVTLVLLLISVISYAGIHTVDNRLGSGANFASINTAMVAATSGDTIYIHPSSASYGSITVTKNLVFIGPGHHPEFTGGAAASIAVITLSNGSSNSKFIGLSIDRISCYVWATSHNIEIRNNYFYYHQAIVGAYGDNSDSDNWIIQGNVIIENDVCGGCALIDINYSNGDSDNSNWIISNNFIITRESTSNSTNLIDYMNASTIVENNIIIHRNTRSLFESHTTGGELINNVIWVTQDAFTDLTEGATNIAFSNNLTYHANGTLVALTGDDNIDNSDPDFTFLTDDVPDWNYLNNYQLGASSLGIDAGIDGTDVGIYGGGFSFRMEGYPQNFPRFIDFDVLSTTVVPQGGTLEISINATRAGL